MELNQKSKSQAQSQFNPFSDTINLKFVAQTGENLNCIGDFQVHKFALLQCKYFQIMLNTKWDISDTEKNIAEVEFLDNSWYSVSSAIIFIACLYNSNNSKTLIARQSLKTCIELHKLLDFFEFEFLRMICSNTIVSKLQNDDDYNLLCTYVYEITTHDKILETAVKHWSIWKNISKLSGPEIISENSFSIGFEIAYSRNSMSSSSSSSSSMLSSFLDLVNNQQRRFSCFGIDWIFQVSRHAQKTVTISLILEASTFSKYEVEFKFGIYGKEKCTSFFRTLWITSGQPKTILCTISKLNETGVFYSNSECKYFVPVFLAVEIKQAIHPIDFDFTGQDRDQDH